jgi:hypothetical protein
MSHADKMRELIYNKTLGHGKTTGLCQAIKPESCKKVEKYCSVSKTPRPGGVPSFGPRHMSSIYGVPMVSEEYCTKKRGGPEIDKNDDEFYDLVSEEDIVGSLYKQKRFSPGSAPPSNAAAASVAPAKSKITAKYKCGDIKAEKCAKFKKYCEVPDKLYLSSKPKCLKIRGGPELDLGFDQLIEDDDLFSPEERQHLEEEKRKAPKLREWWVTKKCEDIIPQYCDNYLPYCKKTSTGKCLKKKGGPPLHETSGPPLYKELFVISPEHRVEYTMEPSTNGPEFMGAVVIRPEHRVGYVPAAVPAVPPKEDLSILSEVVVPSPEKLVVSDLPKSNSGVAKTEQVMEQVLAANVSKGMLSRQKSVEILDSPAAQHYADLRQHLTQGEVQQLNLDMTAVHAGVETILEQHLATAEEKKALQALFDQYDLCQYVRTAEDKKLTIPKLTNILTSFGQVDKRVRQATTRSTICYIILSVVLMDPKTFIEKLAGINKGTYSKK